MGITGVLRFYSYMVTHHKSNMITYLKRINTLKINDDLLTLDIVFNQ